MTFDSLMRHLVVVHVLGQANAVGVARLPPLGAEVKAQPHNLLALARLIQDLIKPRPHSFVVPRRVVLKLARRAQ